MFGATEIVSFRNHLANTENVSAAKHNQALNVTESYDFTLFLRLTDLF